MTKTRFKNFHLLSLLRLTVLVAGIFFLLCFFLAFTTLPFHGIHWLGTSKTEFKWEPQTIILLGGGGMPSESNLMRSWYTALAAESFHRAKVIIAMPGEINDSISTPQQMRKELVMRGINTTRIMYENNGTNTRAQALNCKNLIDTKDPILLVTSPEHTRRAVLCFRKTGFEKINALPAFENAAEADLTFKDDELGGNKALIPDVGKNISLRYQLWNHLKYEINFIREMTAICYYKIRGWI